MIDQRRLKSRTILRNAVTYPNIISTIFFSLDNEFPDQWHRWDDNDFRSRRHNIQFTNSYCICFVTFSQSSLFFFLSRYLINKFKQSLHTTLVYNVCLYLLHKCLEYMRSVYKPKLGMQLSEQCRYFGRFDQSIL